ncbi:MAG TPA: HAMP domain-containing sensor histidine kinase [Bacteroidales bacterium]|nr:HAMP domain-containing sensor histidine kinase [Bacteroidales bacterium]HRW97242.1 HAMP domain-containing sensor histidine kinase [Bacteroidales bacterium]
MFNFFTSGALVFDPSDHGLFILININPVITLVVIPVAFLTLGIVLGILVEQNKRSKTKFAAKPETIEAGEKTSETIQTVSTEEELRLLNATKDKFFSIIAHDLKNPFNSLLGFSDLLVNDFDQYEKDDIKRFLKIMHDSSKHGFNLLENLLQWSRTQTGRIAFIPSKVIINDILTGCVDLLKPTADNKQIKIYMEVPENIEVTGDIEMLSTVFRNLISNAIKFTPENGRIKIKVRLLTQRAEISVIDTGVGIAPENIANLFRIDKQVSTLGTKNEKGTGLGLILCKEFVDKHKGIIKVSSERKNGTEFKVFLPLEQQKQGANVKRNQPQKFVEAG